MADPVQEQVLSAAKAAFEARTDLFPGVRVTYATEPNADRRGYALAILAPTQVYQDRLSPNSRDRLMDVELQVSGRAPRVGSAAVHARAILANVEMVAAKSATWGHLATQVVFNASSVNFEDSKDKTFEVSLFLGVGYRTQRDDPFNTGGCFNGYVPPRAGDFNLDFSADFAGGYTP